MSRPGRIPVRVLIMLLLFASTLAVFARTGDSSFVSFDDGDYVYDNLQVRQGLTTQGIRWAFTSFHASNWHPLAWLSHMLDVTLFGLEPRGHHMVSVALHGTTAALLFLLVLQVTGAVWRGALVAALFALHPLHVESVAWVSERKDILCAFFFLLTLLAYRRYCRRPGNGRYAAVTVLSVMALLAKPMAVTLPLIMLILDWWPLGRLGGPFPGSRRNLLMEKVPLVLISVASSVLALAAQHSGGAVVSMENIPVRWRVANAFSSYATYLVQTVWPSALSPYYPHPEAGLPSWRIFASVVLLAAVSLIAIRARKRQPWMLAGWLWYLGMLLPVIGSVQVGAQARADRYTYLPLIGIFLIAAWCGERLSRRSFIAQSISALAALSVLAALASAAWVQVGYWRNSRTLYERALMVTNGNWLAHHNLGLVLLGEGRDAEALDHFREVLKIQPLYTEAHFNTAVTLESMGNTEEAVAHYREVIRMEPSRAVAYNNLGQLIARKGHLPEATLLFRQAVRRGPGLAIARRNLGIALMQGGMFDEAIPHLQEALRTSPSDEKTRKLLDQALSRRVAKP